MVGLSDHHNIIKQCCALYSRHFHSRNLENHGTSANASKINCGQVFKGELLDLLIKRKFLNVSHCDVTAGLLGKEMMQNIKSEWRRSVKKKWGLKMIEGEIEIKHLAVIDGICDVISQQMNSSNQEHLSSSSFALNLTEADQRTDTLALVKFVENSAAELELENFHSEGVGWAKNYLRKPAEVRSKWESNVGHAMKEVKASYGDGLPLQHSVLLPPDFLRGRLEVSLPSSTSILITHHQLGDLLAVSLVDSHHTVKFPNYEHTMMRIHPHLAPVKAFLSVEEEQDGALQQLASEMTDWLRRMGVSCWNATELGMDYSDMDESGVPYGIVLSVQTLQDGILCVRHRDSSLKIQTHVSELVAKLKLYLQPR